MGNLSGLVNNLKQKLKALVLTKPSTELKVDDRERTIIEHTIKEGETLYSLANKYETTLNRILELNAHIENPSLIYTDDVLKIETPLQK